MLEVELHSKDIHALRNDKQKNFFDLDQCDGANSALAVEKNYIFVMNLTCTLAGCPAYPCHGDFKVGTSSHDHEMSGLHQRYTYGWCVGGLS